MKNLITTLYSIAKNTFIETIRQPVYAIIIIAAVLLYILAPSITMYTLDEDIKLLRELGLSTLFLAGLFIAVFSATGAITEEIETKTITTILSKPVPRPIFILGKFTGVAVAVIIAHYLLTAVYLMVIRFGVLERASDEPDIPVVLIGSVVLLATIIISAFLNYSYDWSFSASAILTCAILSAFGILFLTFIDKEWKFGPMISGFNRFDLYASLLLLFGTLVLVAVAVLFSSRFNVVLTLTFCILIFLLGLISDWVASQYAAKYLWAQIYTAVVPNMQVFWVSDAIYETGSVPGAYLLKGLSYATCYTAGVLALAVALFQRRQVG
jgi:hypothetical protein